MRLAPLTRTTRLFARRVINLGSGVRLLPGQELITNRLALSWRRITQLYEQRRVLSEADPYFEEVMRGPGLKNNHDFAKAWLEGSFVPDAELDYEPEPDTELGNEPDETVATEPENTEIGTKEDEGTNDASEPKSRNTLHHKGGGWYDVLKDGKAVNKRPLRKEEAEVYAHNEDDLLS